MICQNIYSHGIAPEIDNQELDGVYLNHALIRCLLYADDLVLSSLSSVGLQRQLDRLLSYCQKWELVVNVLKKVCMFVKYDKGKGYSAPSIYYNGTELTYVEVFKYVGACSFLVMMDPSVIKKRQ